MRVMSVSSSERSSAGDGAGAMLGHGLAPSPRAHGARVPHRRGAALFQRRIELQIEVRLFSLLDQHTASYQGAGDACDQGVEQLAQLGGRRRRCAVEVGFVVLEGIGAIGNEKVEVDIEIKSRSIALNEGDNPRLAAPAGT